MAFTCIPIEFLRPPSLSSMLVLEYFFHFLFKLLLEIDLLPLHCHLHSPAHHLLLLYILYTSHLLLICLRSPTSGHLKAEVFCMFSWSWSLYICTSHVSLFSSYLWYWFWPFLRLGLHFCETLVSFYICFMFAVHWSFTLAIRYTSLLFSSLLLFSQSELCIHFMISCYLERSAAYLEPPKHIKSD